MMESATFTKMIKIYLLVVSLWGFNGSAWVYTGNQMVYQDMGRKFMKFDMNKYFTFKVQCIEDVRKDI